MGRIEKHSLIDEYKEEFYKQYKDSSSIISIAPGRVNIIGEHTDYNKGFAMPVAINRWILSLVSMRNDQHVNVYSINYNKKIVFSLNDYSDKGDLWERYVKGAIYLINKKYNLTKGFNIVIGGNIPIGFGMSSSAALEVSIVGAILSLCNLEQDKYEILKICNLLEREILGIKSGMLDQYASIFSNKNKFLLIDFLKLEHSYIDSNIKGSCWILINSLVSRELMHSDYNQRVDECNDAIELINQKTNKKHNLNSIDINVIEVIKENKNLYKRLLHLITENKRVFKMKDAILKGDLNIIGDLLSESHESLSKNYDVSCEEIDLIIELSKKHPGFYGGRIMGGGFGGCTINLIKSNLKEDFISYVKDKFYDKYDYDIKIETVNFSSGLDIVTF